MKTTIPIKKDMIFTSPDKQIRIVIKNVPVVKTKGE